MAAHQAITRVTYKTLPGYEGYCFGDDGSVWSCRTTRGALSETWRRLRGTPSTHYGHIKVEVTYRGQRVVRSFHRLILEAFVGPCPPGLEACHGPGGKTDNRVENLRWGTHESNIRDKVRDGTERYGERSATAKITDVQAAQVIHLRSLGLSYRAISRRTEVPLATVEKIAQRKQWKHLYRGDVWRALIQSSDSDSPVAV